MHKTSTSYPLLKSKPQYFTSIRGLCTQELIWNLYMMSAVDQRRGNQSGHPKWGQVDACGRTVIMRRKQSMWLVRWRWGLFHFPTLVHLNLSMFLQYWSLNNFADCVCPWPTQYWRQKQTNKNINFLSKYIILIYYSCAGTGLTCYGVTWSPLYDILKSELTQVPLQHPSWIDVIFLGNALSLGIVV